WCHVMAHETFADAEVAQLLNENFVAVKVDREERPDLDQIYMLSCQFFTGSGGWPLSVFITPEGLPFFAGTYFPKQSDAELKMPGFIEILNYISGRWQSERQGLIANGEKVAELLRSHQLHVPALEEALSADLLGSAAEHLSENFDGENGGFGEAPKFPTPHQLLFLLHWHQRSGSHIAFEMVEKTLAKMAAGGICDHLGGGFHRYAVDKKWQIPHFEKMLYDQAMIALVYTEAYKVSGKQLYAEVVDAIFAYVERDLQGENGLFYAAQDADSEGLEGAFYVWTKAQIKSELGEFEGELFCRHYGVDESGNFPEIEASSVLHLVAENSGEDSPEFIERLALSREKLFAARALRPTPFVDNKIVTAWNGLMIVALAKAATVFAKPHFLKLAETAAGALKDNCERDNNRLWRLGSAGENVAIPAFLDDYAYLIWGLIELDGAGSDPEFMAWAKKLTVSVNELFWDAQGERFFYSGSDAEKLLARNLELHDGVLPGSNSVMISNLLRLSSAGSDNALYEQAGKALGRGASVAAKTPLLYLHYLTVLGDYLP
ncbi:thioredoxin domain-containing protein, partial [bacterium]|nr:thioredoxin domain-containing protein [bacterium]